MILLLHDNVNRSCYIECLNVTQITFSKIKYKLKKQENNQSHKIAVLVNDDYLVELNSARAT